MDSFFTNKYPGPRRITLCGPQNGDAVTIKVFGADSVIEHATGRGRRAGLIGGTYPIKKVKIHRNGRDNNEYRNAIKTEAIKLAKKYNRLVVDDNPFSWGFYEDESIPFNDEILF